MRTYILPTIAWDSLLPMIVKDAQPGDVIETHTEEMQQRAQQVLDAASRTDLTIRLTPPRASRPPAGDAELPPSAH